MSSKKINIKDYLNIIKKIKKQKKKNSNDQWLL